MKTNRSLRALVTALIAITITVLAPATASARPGPAAEPIMVVGGFDPDCAISNYEDGTQGYPETAMELTVDGIRKDAAYKWGVQPIPPSWAAGFTTPKGYEFCRYSTTALGRRFYDWMVKRIAAWNQAVPPGYDRVTKVDVVGTSYGSTITRSCIANAGRANPATATPDCAKLIDDWIGLVPPSHGSKTPWVIGCPFAPGALCKATSANGDFLLKLNERFNGDAIDRVGAGDETPQVPGTTPIEYSTYWGGADGLITPVQSAGLWGAANYRVQAGMPTATTRARQLNHLKIADTGICKGSPDFGTSGTREWVLYELLDVAPHQPTPEESPRKTPTNLAPYSVLNCKSAPPGLTPPKGDINDGYAPDPDRR